MASVNQVYLIGRIGKEPVITQTNDGKPVVKFSLATTDSWTDKITKEKKEKTEWHRIVVYNNARLKDLFETQKDDLVGALVHVSGSLKYEKWTNKLGVEQKITSIVIDTFSGKFVILSKKNKSSTEFHKKSEDENSNQDVDFSLEEDDSDEIPF